VGPTRTFTQEQTAQANAAWHNRKLKTWAQVKEKFPEGFTLARAYKLWGARE
jgi:hypothetical protein